MAMIWGYKKGSSEWVKHDEHGVWSLKIEETGIEDGGLSEIDLLRNYEYEAHGWWLWSSWFFFGLGLLITKRYAKKHWNVMHYLHAFLGYFVMVVTIVYALKLTKWNFMDNLHNAFGTIMLFLTILGSLSGTFTAGTMKAYNGDKDWSAKERVERVAKFHRITGYVMLLFGNITCMTGIAHYFGDILKDEGMMMLGLFSLLTFIFFVIIFEAIFRVRNKYSLGHVKTTMTINEGGKTRSYTPAEIDH